MPFKCQGGSPIFRSCWPGGMRPKAAEGCLAPCRPGIRSRTSPKNPPANDEIDKRDALGRCVEKICRAIECTVELGVNGAVLSRARTEIVRQRFDLGRHDLRAVQEIVLHAEIRMRVHAATPANREVVNQIGNLGNRTELPTVVRDIEQRVRRRACAPTPNRIIRQRISRNRPAASLCIPSGIEQRMRRAAFAPTVVGIVLRWIETRQGHIAIEAQIAIAIEQGRGQSMRPPGQSLQKRKHTDTITQLLC